MTSDEAKKAITELWLEKADESLESAELELRAGHTTFALNRIYYACFYAITALLHKEGKSFSKHSAVKAEFNRRFVKTLRVEKHWGKFFGSLFEDRQEGDYLPIIVFDAEDIASRLEQAREFILVIRKLLFAS